MPLDDLDDFLAMELGTPNKQLKTSQQVNSLEALVLSRVQKACPPEEQPPKAQIKTLDIPLTKPSIDPIYQLLDLLVPLINKLQLFLEDPNLLTDKQALSDERSILAEELLALPEINLIDKPEIFAVIASCIDAVSSTKLEKRLAAQTRLETLSQTLILAKQQVQ